MYLVVHHRVTDHKGFLATDSKDIGGNAPAGVVVKYFLPARDTLAADCLWDAPLARRPARVPRPGDQWHQREHLLRGRRRLRDGPARGGVRPVNPPADGRGRSRR